MSSVAVELVEIEVARRLGHRLLPSLLQRFLESTRQIIIPGALGLQRLLKQRLAARSLIGNNPGGLIKFRSLTAIRLAMRDNTSQVDINSHRGAAARTRELELALQLRHASHCS